MDTFFHPITFIGASGERVTVDALVDTGATFSSLPAETLERLGVRPVREVRLRLADGSSHIQAVGRVLIELEGDEETTLVIFGEPNSPPTIGAYALEGLMLGVDPFGHRLLPIEGWRA